MGKHFIKLYDQITRWEWYKNGNTCRLFIHLLLKANYRNSRFEGRTIYRGQVVTSLIRLSAETGMTIKEIRTALSHLIQTGEVANQSASQYRVITVLKYNEYQNAAGETTDKRQTTDSQASDEGQTKDRPRANEGQHQ